MNILRLYFRCFEKIPQQSIFYNDSSPDNQNNFIVDEWDSNIYYENSTCRISYDFIPVNARRVWFTYGRYIHEIFYQ